MSDILEQAKLVLKNRQGFETSLSSAQAVLKSKEEGLDKFQKEVRQSFPTVNTLEDLQNSLKADEAELAQVLERIKTEAPELLA